MSWQVNILDKFAARLNSFKIGYRDYWPGKNDINTFDLLTRASKAGINAADLNFPDHFENIKLQELNEKLKQLNIHLNGLAMRYYSEEKFKFLQPNGKESWQIQGSEDQYPSGQTET